MTTLHIDFETASLCELKDRGLHNYATDPSTIVHCMAYCFDEGPVELAIPGDDFPFRVFQHVEARGEVVAHNAAFELAIWNNVLCPRYGWPPLFIAQMRCTMAAAYAMALPGALDDAAAALGVQYRKDTEGYRVMLQLAKPNKDGRLWQPSDDPAKFDKLYAYCKQDVVVERELDKRLARLSDAEQKLWVIDQYINNRGIQVDLPSIDLAIQMVEKEKTRLDAEMLRTTGGVVGRCTEVQLLCRWMESQGVKLPGLRKSDVIDALKLEDVPPQVRKALLLRQEAAKSSTAKLIAMKNRASTDGRVRGSMQYHGASTGRWAGRGIQVQNFPRPRPHTKPEHIEDIIEHMADREYVDMLYGPAMDALADSLRGMLMAGPGKELVAMDFSAIEARVLAWLAGEEGVLDIFRSHGKIYEHAASGIYGKPMEDIAKEERQIGKVAVLALGYQGGVGAFQSMARVYGVKVSDERADEIKTAWRQSHPNIVRYWWKLEDAAIDAVSFGGKVSVGQPGRQVTFLHSGSFLWCKLPSGRVLCYPYPTIKPVETPWGEQKNALHFWTVNGTTKKWEETNAYGGLLSENLTQAVARDLLAEAIVRLEAAGYDTVFHAHDEVVIEVPAGTDEHHIQKRMEVVPDWAEGLPLAAEGWRAKRYRK